MGGLGEATGNIPCMSSPDASPRAPTSWRPPSARCMLAPASARMPFVSCILAFARRLSPCRACCSYHEGRGPGNGSPFLLIFADGWPSSCLERPRMLLPCPAASLCLWEERRGRPGEWAANIGPLLSRPCLLGLLHTAPQPHASSPLRASR